MIRLRLVPLLLAATCALAHAAPLADDKRQALAEFSRAYGLARAWPAMAPKIARDSLPRLREAAFAELAADLGDSPARARAEARLDTLVDGARGRLESALRELDADELAAYTAYEIYARYFETGEIRALTAFFDSATGRKLTGLGPAELASARETGDGIAPRFSPAEREEIAAFLRSPAGEKLRSTALDVREDLHRHFVERTEPALRALARALAAQAEQQEP